MTERDSGQAEQGEDRLDERDLRLLRQTFVDAEHAGRAGERPFAAIVVAPDGRVAATAINRQVSTGDFAEHAELGALRRAYVDNPERVAGGTLYASSEPCAMCSAGAFFAGIARVVFGTSGTTTYTVTPRPGQQLTMRTAAVLGAGDRRTTVVGPVLEAEGERHLRAAHGDE